MNPPNYPNDSRIWRYVDLPRLLSMLENRSLFFARVDKLDDPFEGSVSLSDYEEYENALQESAVDSGIAPGYWLRENSKVAVDERRYTFVNCWHLRDSESAAMWKLYADQGKGLAVQSTLGRLRACLPREVAVEPIRYIDFEAESTLGNRFFTKRKEFDHEQELRALICDHDRLPSAGIEVSVELDNLIETVVVGPLSPTWFGDLAHKLISRYNKAYRVGTSRLTSKPRHRVG